MSQRQVDWAERKASQFGWLDHDSIVQIAHALRLERARAVRVCTKLAQEHVVGGTRCVEQAEFDHVYRRACDDCATAIKGKP